MFYIVLHFSNIFILFIMYLNIFGIVSQGLVLLIFYICNIPYILNHY